MGKFDGVLLVSDIDGTLYGNDFRLKKENAEAIEYFKSEGGRFTLASGRSLKDVEEIGRPICNTYFIGLNGTVIGNRNELLHGWQFGAELQPILRKVATEFLQSDIEFVSDEGIFIYHANRFSEFHRSCVSDSVFECIEALSDAPKRVRMMAFWMDTTEMDGFSHWFSANGFLKSVTGFKGFRHSYECVPLGCSKGAAASLLAEKLNAKLLVTAGDNGNDVAMLKAAELSFAPKNASDEAKAAAKVLLSRDADHTIMPEIVEKLENFLKKTEIHDSALLQTKQSGYNDS